MKTKEQKLKEKEEKRQEKRDSKILMGIVVLSALIAIILSIISIPLFGHIVKGLDFNGEDILFEVKMTIFVSVFSSFSALFLGIISLYQNLKQRSDNKENEIKINQIREEEKRIREEQIRLDFLYRNMDAYLEYLQKVNQHYSTDSYLINFLKIKSLLDKLTPKSSLKEINANYVEIRSVLEMVDNHLMNVYYTLFQDKHYIPQVEIVLNKINDLRTKIIEVRKKYFESIEITYKKETFFSSFDSIFSNLFNELIILSNEYTHEWNKYMLNIMDFISNLKYSNNLEGIEELFMLNLMKKRAMK